MLEQACLVTSCNIPNPLRIRRHSEKGLRDQTCKLNIPIGRQHLITSWQYDLRRSPQRNEGIYCTHCNHPSPGLQQAGPPLA